MRTTVCILFLFVATYAPQRYNCLHLIELPSAFQVRTNAAKLDNAIKKAPSSRSKSFSRYLLNLPNDLAEHYLKETRRSQTMLPKVKDGLWNLVDSRNKILVSPILDVKKAHDNNTGYSYSVITERPYPPVRPTRSQFDHRRLIPVGNGTLKALRTGFEYLEEREANMKIKISTLVQQTIHNTEKRLASVNEIKNHYRGEAPYRAGFILSMIKKTRDIMNELFTVAVKHKDDYRNLQQMNFFEMIVRSNVDTTNLVRQLIEIHVQHINTTSPGQAEVEQEQTPEAKRRVVLLK